jgi:hypothetical protein
VSRPRSLSLRVPLYGARVQVFAAATARDARYAAARRPGLRELPPLAAGELGACLALPDGGPIVLALPFTASPGIVAHECAHAAAEVLARAGVPLTTKADEAFCYVLQHVVDRVAPWLARAHQGDGSNNRRRTAARRRP